MIAASRRILSALDDVPSGVIPANIALTSATWSNTAPLDIAASATSDGITSIDSARKSTGKEVHKRVIPWRRIGSIAALLLVAVTVVRFGAMGDDVAEPVGSVANESAKAIVAPGAANTVASAAPVADVATDAAARERSAPAVESTPKSVAAVAQSKPEPLMSAKASTPASSRGLAIADALPSANVIASAGAATTGPVTSAPPAGAATGVPVPTPPTTTNRTASLPTTANAPVVPPPSVALRDSAALRGAVEATLRQPARRGDTTGNAARLMLRAPSGQQLASSPASSGSRAGAFDSVTLIRTNCAPSCESITLHVNASGVVRYVVGGGNAQRVVMSQLSPSEREQVEKVLAEAFPGRMPGRVRTVCTLSGTGDRTNARDHAPELQLLVDFPDSPLLGAAQECGKSEAELRAIGTRLDEIVGAAALRRRVPLEE